MKQTISWITTVILVAALVLFSKEVLLEEVTLIQIVTLFGVINLLKYLINIESTVNYLKAANNMQYDEYEGDAKYIKQKLFNIQDLLGEIYRFHFSDKTKEHKLELPSFIDIRKKADTLKSQAEMEESDSKALGLMTKSKRESNLAAAIESGLLSRIGIFYTTTWDNKQNCLRIQNYSNSGKVAIFYPKSNKLNFDGKWFEHAVSLLEKEITRCSNLPKDQSNDAK